MIDKAVILARGLGKRMRRSDQSAALDDTQSRIADSGVKAMIPIGRPFLDYVLNALVQAGFRRICLVIGPEHQVIRDYYTQKVRLARLEISFAVQDQPLGTADAVSAARDFAGKDDFLVINSDNYYPPAAFSALSGLDGMGLIGFDKGGLCEGNIPPERIAGFAVIQTDSAGLMVRIIEKPSAEQLAKLGRSVVVSMNCWRFGPAIFDACRAIGPSPRGELELTDAVQYSIDKLGVGFKVVPMRLAVLDMSSRQDVAEVARRLEGVEISL